MPIHNVGYRSWTGVVVASWQRWWIIALSGIRIATKSVWVRRIVLACWLPIFYWGAGFAIFERAYQSFSSSNSEAAAWLEPEAPSFDSDTTASERVQKTADEGLKRALQKAAEEAKRAPNVDLKRFPPSNPNFSQRNSQEKLIPQMGGIGQAVDAATEQMLREQMVDRLEDRFEAFPAIDKLAQGLRSRDMNEVRHTFWNWMLMTYFRYPQLTAVIFLLGFVTPALIARDIRSRALVLYFSRPIGRWEYLVGKLTIPATFLLVITTLPALVLYVLGIFLSPDLSVLWATWDVPIRIVLASGVLILPTCSLALMLSSLSQESRFSAFAWFAVWVLGHGAWLAILVAASAHYESDPFQVAKLPNVQRWAPVSLYNSLGMVQSWLFGFETWRAAWPSALVLGGITVVSFSVLYRRISRSVHV